MAKQKGARGAKQGRFRAAADPQFSEMTRDGYLLSDRIVALSGGSAFTFLANDLIDNHLAVGRRGFGVCAPSAGSGATFLAANLAIALARAGISTLLVDANLEAPGVEKLIAPPQPPSGLRQILTAPYMSLPNVLAADVLPRLSVLYAGPVGDSPSDTFEIERLERFVSSCLRDFQCTIFDLPAANRSTLTRTVGALAGYALVVARRDVSFADDVELLSQQLRQDGIEVIGAVLNEG